MTDIPDTPEDKRLVTILASDPYPGRVDRARMRKRDPRVRDELCEPIPPEDIEATRAELAELRQRMTRKAG